jgi:uncharacterized DUF497 family protein
MVFEWDERKAVRNERCHGVRFGEAVGVFADSHAFEFVDEAHTTESEVRYGIIGLIPLGMVYVCFTERSADRVRMIHARRAEPWMVEEYEKQRKRI